MHGDAYIIIVSILKILYPEQSGKPIKHMAACRAQTDDTFKI